MCEDVDFWSHTTDLVDASIFVAARLNFRFVVLKEVVWKRRAWFSGVQQMLPYVSCTSNGSYYEVAE